MGDRRVFVEGYKLFQGELDPDNGYQGHMREGFGQVVCQGFGA